MRVNISSPYLEDAEKMLDEFAMRFKDFADRAVIDYEVGSRICYDKPHTWPLKIFGKQGKVDFRILVASATCGYRGRGPLFTFETLKKFGFEVNIEESFSPQAENRIHLEFQK